MNAVQYQYIRWCACLYGYRFTPRYQVETFAMMIEKVYPAHSNSKCCGADDIVGSIEGDNKSDNS